MLHSCFTHHWRRSMAPVDDLHSWLADSSVYRLQGRGLL